MSNGPHTLTMTAAIVAKDVRQRLKDGSLLVFGLLLPLGVAFFFNMLLGDGSSQGTGSEYVVADSDSGSLGAEFVDEALRPLEDDGVLELTAADSEEEARDLVENGGADAAFLVPEDFSESLEAGDEAVLTVVGDADSPVATHIAREIARAYATEHLRIRLALASGFDSEPSPEDAALLLEEAETAEPPLAVVEDSELEWRELGTATYYSASMAFFFVFFAAMFSVTSIFDEKAGGTLARLLASPIPRGAVLVAKLTSGLVIGLANMAVLAVATSVFFGADWGDPLGAAALILTGVVAVIGLTAAVASFARSSEQAANWLSVLAMLLGVFGGALFPISQLNALAIVSYLTPHRWFLLGLGELSAGGLHEVLLPCAVLLVLGLVGTTVALFRMGRMVNA
ncbi:ABC transporter permease [Nocardiopsis tropica]|uniref:ABC transporter permease n=1 Tax=Nocardiopsis tropica TaxID=109330 RepID=A0ABU7KU25_9ACTN|nr:ABC transporter permease [Nocardiopsis umidischolae]MEE2052798.1 ABC transporter permease [Nocardiopsis umidischolae]